MRKIGRSVIAGAVLAGLVSFVPAQAAPASPRAVEPGVLNATTPLDVIARFADSIPRWTLHAPGVRIHYRFESIPAFTATATPDALRLLARDPHLAYLEADKPIRFALDTATKATRAHDVWDPKPPAEPLRDASGHIIDGTGLGIAIVDSGLDGTHPDFAAPGKVARNVIATPAGFVASTYTNAGAAHGTHVAGIAAGPGTASGGLNRGAAPGASIYMFSVGVAGTIQHAAMAFDWILKHGAEQNPPIRVVNNSWGCGSAACSTFNPYQVHNYLASALARSGVVVTFAAGNDGGDGWVSVTNEEANNQTPGIIAVANYSDIDLGKRDGCMASSSSRGASSTPSTWPDVAAPGTKIMSTWPIGIDGTNTPNTRTPDGKNTYREFSGTSMAAPHVAGIAALMLHANPSLSAAEVEFILKNTARKSTNEKECGVRSTAYVNADALDTLDGSNYIGGHGLVDALSAVTTALSFDEIPSMPEPEAIPDSFLAGDEGVDVEQTLFAHPDGSLTPEFPGEAQTAYVVDPVTPVSFTSAPLTDPADYSGFAITAFFGTTGDLCRASLNAFWQRAEVIRVAAGGGEKRLGASEKKGTFVCPAAPFPRELQVVLGEAEHFDPGDRIRLTLLMRQTGTVVVPSNPGPESHAIVYVGAATPTRIAFGAGLEHPAAGSPAECFIREDCADLAGPVVEAPLVCGAIPIALSWEGPPGSGIMSACDTNVYVCVVAGAPGDPWGTCRQDGPLTTVWAQMYGECRSFGPDGGAPPPGAHGRCLSTRFRKEDPPRQVE